MIEFCTFWQAIKILFHLTINAEFLIILKINNFWTRHQLCCYATLLSCVTWWVNLPQIWVPWLFMILWVNRNVVRLLLFLSFLIFSAKKQIKQIKQQKQLKGHSVTIFGIFEGNCVKSLIFGVSNKRIGFCKHLGNSKKAIKEMSCWFWRDFCCFKF